MNSSMTYKLICTTLSLKDPLIQRTFCQHKPISSSSSYSKEIQQPISISKTFIFAEDDLFPQTIKHILLHISRICVIYLVVWLIPI